MLTHSRSVFIPSLNKIVRTRDYRRYDPATKAESPHPDMPPTRPVSPNAAQKTAHDLTFNLTSAELESLADAAAMIAYKMVESYKQGMRTNPAEWPAEMQREMRDLIEIYTTLHPEWVSKEALPADAILCRGIWRLETKDDGRLRARLVIDGNRQEADTSKHESFYAPTPLKRSMRILHFYRRSRDWKSRVIDIEKAFLNSDKKYAADRNMWLECPPGVFPEHQGKYCRVVGTLYRQRNAPSDWHQTFRSWLMEHQWTRVDQDPCVYIRRNKHGKIFAALEIHVDDIEIHGTTKKLDAFQQELGKDYKYRIKEDSHRVYCGTDIEDVSDYTLLSGKTYLRELAKQYPATTVWKEPMEPRSRFPSGDGRPGRYNKEFRSLVGKAIYAVSSFAFNALFAALRAAMHLHEGTHEQVQAARRIVEYIHQHPVAIVIPSGPVTEWVLSGYTDSDLAGLPNGRSTMAGVILLNGILIDCYSRVQSTVALSTFEAEYVGLAELCRELLAVMHFLSYLDITIKTATIFCDQEKVVMSVYSGQIVNSRQVRHLLIRFEHVVDHVAAGRIKVVWVNSKNNWADPFTKQVSADETEKQMKGLGLRLLESSVSLSNSHAEEGGEAAKC
jgi:hypothetical protein